MIPQYPLVIQRFTASKLAPVGKLSSSAWSCALTIACFALTSVVASAQGKPWEFGVTRDGLPRLELSIRTGIAQPPQYSEMWIRHRLVFDGAGYRSRIFLPLFETNLQNRGNGKYVWRSIDGLEYLIGVGHERSGVTVKSTSNRVELTAGPQSFLVYVDTKIERMSFWGATLLFERAGATLGLNQITPVRKEIATVDLDERGRAKRIVFSSSLVYDIEYNEFNSITRITQAETRDVLASFGYENGLLSEWKAGTAGRKYRWDIPRTPYVKGAVQPPPYVRDDGEYHYQMSYLPHGYRIEYASPDNTTALGEWEANSLFSKFTVRRREKSRL